MTAPNPAAEAPREASLERLRAQLIALLQAAPPELIEDAAAHLLPAPDPLREGAPDETTVGYAGEREITMGMLRDRARGADEAIARGDFYTSEQILDMLNREVDAE